MSVNSQLSEPNLTLIISSIKLEWYDAQKTVFVDIVKSTSAYLTTKLDKDGGKQQDK
jgi:hypothetical protein